MASALDAPLLDVEMQTQKSPAPKLSTLLLRWKFAALVIAALVAVAMLVGDWISAIVIASLSITHIAQCAHEDSRVRPMAADIPSSLLNNALKPEPSATLPDAKASEWWQHDHATVRQLSEVIKDAADLLPHQAILQNFVHHNPWESLQSMPFFEALEHAEIRAAFMSPAERLFRLTKVDPRMRANEAMAELCSVFLDRGAAKWEAPHRYDGLLHFFASLEDLGLAPWRASARACARRVLADPLLTTDSHMLAETMLYEGLVFFGTPATQWTATTRAMLLDLVGWAGMISRMQAHPTEAPANARVQLCDFVAVYTILTQSSCDALARQSGWDGRTSLQTFLEGTPIMRGVPRPVYSQGAMHPSLQNPSALAHTNQNEMRRDALEKEYESATLAALGETTRLTERPAIQFFTCFDERECSFRRHLEGAATFPSEVETYGVPGFFNLAIRHYSPCQGCDEVILAPEGSQPPAHHKMVEIETDKRVNERKGLLARLSFVCESASFSPLGSLVLAIGLLPCSVVQLAMVSLCPTTTRKLAQAGEDALVPPSSTTFASPFAPNEAASKLAQLLHNIGLKERFAPLVIVLSHGSRSVNNPFDAAHNCGACGGREGGPNARLMANCANDSTVRQQLRMFHGISIPHDTWFVGGYHDTTSELVELFDVDEVPETHAAAFVRAKAIIFEARGNNAIERCSKFMRAPVLTAEAALSHVMTRSTDLGEARPELGHATNASIILGRRELTKGRFFDRRAFLPSYDPSNDDERGTNLETILAPALVVASGISLEYLFSTIDGGAGTKVPMNLVGNFGVLQGTAGDLLVGLPTQMTEMHSPVRALYLIDAPVARLEAVLNRRQELADLVRNDWVRLFVRDPATKEIFRQSRGTYFPIDALPDNRRQPPSVHAVPFTAQRTYARGVARGELVYSCVAMAVMLASCLVPLYRCYILGAFVPMAAYGPFVTIGGTILSLCALCFSHRYLHGEFMFGRFAILSSGLLVGFNLVAMAPSVEKMLRGWSTIGLSSTFLIGAFNDRPTARDNATFAFVVYQLSDCALLVAAALAGVPGSEGLTAAGLLIAALFKSSQFPLTGLFTRSMEGVSPNSALGYAGLSAHAGIVLLSSTKPLWYGIAWARATVVAIGALTATHAGIVANIRADRKGGIACAAASTLGMLFFLLGALGCTELVLLLSFGHAAFRMMQLLRSANWILDAHNYQNALGHKAVAATKVPAPLYKLAWALNRLHTDFTLPAVLQKLDRPLLLNWSGQAVGTCVLVALVVSVHLPQPEERLVGITRTEPLRAAIVMMLNVLTSTAAVRFVFGSVLDFRRFRPQALCE